MMSAVRSVRNRGPDASADFADLPPNGAAAVSRGRSSDRLPETLRERLQLRPDLRAEHLLAHR